MDPPAGGLHAQHEPDTGLPPTPPTMTNSDVSESKPNRSASPVPLFADRVRNALESQRSGLTTPVLENHSPPTPDPSPPRVRQNLLQPHHVRSQSPSSFADSFQTAREASNHSSASVSRQLSPLDDDDEPSQQQQTWLHATMPVRLNGLGLLEDEPMISNDDSSEEHVSAKDYPLPSPGNESDKSDKSDKSVVRDKTYIFSDSEKNVDSDRGDSRVKHYQAESDSDMERRKVDAPSATPPFRKAVHHNMIQHRLRKPLQPGDDIKRPNEALLYGSLGTWKGRKRVNKPQTPPRREKDTTFLRNADLVPPQTPESLIDLSPETNEGADHETPRQLAKDPDVTEVVEEVDAEADDAGNKVKEMEEVPKVLREFAPSESPAMLSPPNTATRERSLEENNNVYRMIQEENAKRHSNVSDNSVQAKVVIPAPESRKKLRHSKKRESLRGDTSLASQSKRSSSDSGHKLRHKRAMDSLGGSEASPEVTPERLNGSLKLSSRISRVDADQIGPDLGMALQVDESPKQAADDPDLVAIRPIKKPAFTPRTLRRSSRQQSLDKQSPLAIESDVRRWSMNDKILGPEAEPSPLTPKLRRSSADRRLDRNNDVRRNSVGRAPLMLSPRLDGNSFDLPRASHEISDQGSMHNHRRSLDKPPLSPRRKGFDPQLLRPIGTPLSTSQFSDRTAMTEAEIGEARGVQYYAHNNDSLVLIQQKALPVVALNALGGDRIDDEHDDIRPHTTTPTFQAYVDAPEENEQSKHTVHSPLTNPRTAPEPPVIKFIPPTPAAELDSPVEEKSRFAAGIEGDTRPVLPRRLSLTQKMRRYSDAVFQPMPFGRSGSLRKSTKHATISGPRPTHLSSFWQPRDFWEEYDSDEDYDPADQDVLPPGGDTSDVVDAKRNFLPRNMSKRMPGFRGTGGFLIGNSLGLDRHGTNKRRHYIDKRTSEEMLRRIAQQDRRRIFTLPFSGGAEYEYVGLDGLGTKLRDAKRKRQERALEKRREKLREQIGTRMYHDGGQRDNA